MFAVMKSNPTGDRSRDKSRRQKLIQTLPRSSFCRDFANQPKIYIYEDVEAEQKSDMATGEDEPVRENDSARKC
jgi:hypothetical protein